MHFVNFPKETPTGVSHHTFFSTLIGQDIGYNIYLPPNYAAGNKPYPVVYWLHGMGGNESSDISLSQFIQKNIAADAPSALKLDPMLMVFVNGTEKSGYVDALDGSLPIESIIIKELIPHIDSTYNTIATREGRAITGFSMGGGGAFLYSVKYPDMFSSVVTYAGAFGNGDDYPIRQNAEHIRGKLKIRMVVGNKDSLFPRNENLHAHLQTAAISHEYIVMDDVDHNLGKLLADWGAKGLRFHNDYMKREG